MRTLSILCLSLIFAISMVELNAQPSEATYKITFTSNWSQTAHPHANGSLPGNAHWSKLVGATHNSDVVFLMMGEHASDGVERIAELGANGVFFDEVNTAITAGTAEQIISGPNLSSAGGQMIIEELTVSSDFSFLTLASMIAPSPDWMIAVNSLNLMDNDANWMESISMDLFPYDSGTDNGIDYVSPNSDTNPPEPISSLTGITPFSNEKIGTLEIELLGSTVNVEDINETGIIKVYPNPTSQFINIVTSDLLIRKISVFSYTGSMLREIEHIETTNYQLDMDNLTSGIYFVKIEDINAFERMSKVVKY